MIKYLYGPQRLILKLQDVILAKVLAPSETVDKKKSAKTSCYDHAETLPGKWNFFFFILLCLLQFFL